MKTGMYDQVLTGVEQMVNKVSDGIALQFKGTKPFAKTPLAPEDELIYYSKLTPDQKNMLLQKHGYTAFEYFNEMDEKLRRHQNA